MFSFSRRRKFPVMPLHCGLLAGEVSICAGCEVYEGWASICIGFIAGIVYITIAQAMENFKLDDPVEAVAVHGGGGFTGLIGVAFFHPAKGILYKWNNESGKVRIKQFIKKMLSDLFQLLGWQLLAWVIICSWSFVWTIITFLGMYYIGVLKAKSDFDSEITIDDAHGHEIAYPETVELQQLVTGRVTPFTPIRSHIFKSSKTSPMEMKVLHSQKETNDDTQA